MKKVTRFLSSFLACLLACTFLLSCSHDRGTPSDFHESVLNVYIRAADKSVSSNILVDWNDAQTILAIYEDPENTVNDIANCACDYIFDLQGTVLYYHSACGNFQDKQNMKSFELSDEDAAVINSIIRRTFE